MDADSGGVQGRQHVARWARARASIKRLSRFAGYDVGDDFASPHLAVESSLLSIVYTKSKSWSNRLRYRPSCCCSSSCILRRGIEE
jgi:hypothetical protein